MVTILLAPVLCGAKEQDGPWAVHGEIVSVDGAAAGWVVFDNSGISSVCCSESDIPKNARKLKHDVYIYPGLIDAHNHAHWNALPSWRAGKKFNSRYEWLVDPDYLKNVNSVFYDKLRNANLEYAGLKYGEIRALIGGGTVLQSTYAAAEPKYLVRNLDSSYGADSRIQDITAITPLEIHRFRSGLADGRTRRIFLHIGEGKKSDAKCANEFGYLESRGLARSGVVVIHGVALGASDFGKMAASDMYLVWSPKSNLVLYGETADVEEALKAKVTVALAPDWTITGSDNVLEEMKVAAQFSKDKLNGRITAKQLFQMVTADAAKAAGVAEQLGRIAVGYSGDMFFAPKLHSDPFESLLLTTPKDVQLVFINGIPVYGDSKTMHELLPDASLDDLNIEGTTKCIHLVGDPDGAWHSQQRFPELLKALQGALPAVAPLIEPNLD